MTGPWFLRWLVFTYAIHVAAQAAGAEALLSLFGYDATGWLKNNRSVTALFLCLHFVCYLVGKLASIERDYLDEIARKRLKDDD